jgi:hypothetical protein
MIQATGHGHVVMSTGPFLQAELRVETGGKVNTYISGDEVALPVSLETMMRVQCAVMDVNRVKSS